MTGKEYLSQYRAVKLKVERLESQMAAVEDLLDSVTVDPTNEHVQTSKDPDQIGKLVAKRSDILADLMDEKAKALDLMQEIYSVINRIDDPDEQLILQLRYIKLLSWRLVEREMEYQSRVYSRRWLFDHHKRALIKVEKIIKCAPICTKIHNIM